MALALPASRPAPGPPPFLPPPRLPASLPRSLASAATRQPRGLFSAGGRSGVGDAKPRAAASLAGAGGRGRGLFKKRLRSAAGPQGLGAAGGREAESRPPLRSPPGSRSSGGAACAAASCPGLAPRRLVLLSAGGLAPAGAAQGRGGRRRPGVEGETRPERSNSAQQKQKSFHRVICFFLRTLKTWYIGKKS